MIVRITIEEAGDLGNSLWRKYDWEVDGDLENKGRAIEEMLEVIMDKTPSKF